jgi:bla regulator protein blaR1
MLSRQVGSTVVDNIGLTGKYDYTLSFAPEDAAAPPEGGGQSQEPVGPSIFTALQEQLGLKLEAKKEPVDVIVIDHIEQPSAN